MKFRIKITLIMICLVSLFFGVGGSLLISISFSGALQREKDLSISSYQSILSTLSLVDSAKGFTDYHVITTSLEALSAQSSSAFSAYRLSLNGKNLFTKGFLPAGTDSSPADTEDCLYFIDNSSPTTSLVLSGLIPLGGTNLLLETARDISPIYQQQQSLLDIYRRIFVVMIVLCAALSYTISRILTGNISNLSRATRALATGNLSYRSKIRAKDEIGLVAENFNKMAERLEENVNNLHEAAKRQESFMGSFAHEIKTPMTSIIGYADLIRSETLTKDEQHEAANYIFMEGKRLEVLSIKLLNILVAADGKAEVNPCSPARIIEGIVAVAAPIYLKRGTELICACQKGTYMLDQDLFKSLIYNLIDNSAKAMDKGGKIKIQQQLIENTCIITVSDTGRGIPEKALNHLTDAFYRVDKARSRSQGGAGLGLALCQKIAELHNGTISFSSVQNKGTTVTIKLNGGLYENS